MSDNVSRETSAPPPATLLRMMTGYWVSQAIYVAAKLGLADRLANGPMSVEALAAATESHAPSLYRVLRALASVGVFTEVPPRHFVLTPLAAPLRTGTPDSLRALAITYNEELYCAWGELLYSIRTGQPAFEHVFGMLPFPYYAQHPEADRTLNEGLAAYTNQVAAAVVATYDFTPFGTIVDVGGGYGTLLAAILQRHPNARGILFDQQHVVDGAERLLTEAGVADRCTRVAGDFFKAVPAGGEVYLLSQILHDWDDDQSVAILRECRRAMPERGKLLVVEIALPSDEQPSIGKWLDLHMLAITGGRERTPAEYDALFRAAGLALARVISTSAIASVIEAVPI